ncbi:MAG: hypothetical protein ACXW5U_31960 [Thermoanaerobaculia bacterium]
MKLSRLLFGLLIFLTPLAQASSHREGLTVINEPCADNTDTYAWVSNGTHAHNGLLQGHGGTNSPTIPDIPDPNAPQP